MTDTSDIFREPYTPKSEEELRELAIEIHAGRVFTSEHCQLPEEVMHVFMGVALLGSEYFQWLLEHDINIFYEKMSEAGPISVNGNPVFLSHGHLTRSEWQTVLGKIKKIEEALEAI